MLENNRKRIFNVDQYFFLPKHVTHSFYPTVKSHKIFMTRKKPEVK